MERPHPNMYIMLFLWWIGPLLPVSIALSKRCIGAIAWCRAKYALRETRSNDAITGANYVEKGQATQAPFTLVIAHARVCRRHEYSCKWKSTSLFSFSLFI